MSAETMGGGLVTAAGARGGAGSCWGRRGMFGEAAVEMARGLLKVEFRRKGCLLAAVDDEREVRVDDEDERLGEVSKSEG